MTRLFSCMLFLLGLLVAPTAAMADPTTPDWSCTGQCGNSADDDGDGEIDEGLTEAQITAVAKKWLPSESCPSTAGDTTSTQRTLDAMEGLVRARDQFNIVGHLARDESGVCVAPQNLPGLIWNASSERFVQYRGAGGVDNTARKAAEAAKQAAEALRIKTEADVTELRRLIETDSRDIAVLNANKVRVDEILNGINVTNEDGTITHTPGLLEQMATNTALAVSLQDSLWGSSVMGCSQAAPCHGTVMAQVAAFRTELEDMKKGLAGVKADVADMKAIGTMTQIHLGGYFGSQSNVIQPVADDNVELRGKGFYGFTAGGAFGGHYGPAFGLVDLSGAVVSEKSEDDTGGMSSTNGIDGMAEIQIGGQFGLGDSEWQMSIAGLGGATVSWTGFGGTTQAVVTGYGPHFGAVVGVWHGNVGGTLKVRRMIESNSNGYVYPSETSTVTPETLQDIPGKGSATSASLELAVRF